jgi:hypothetical protein
MFLRYVSVARTRHPRLECLSQLRPDIKHLMLWLNVQGSAIQTATFRAQGIRSTKTVARTMNDDFQLNVEGRC